MDCPVSAQSQPALAGFSLPHQHRILPSLALLATRQAPHTPRAAVVPTLKA